MSVMSLVGKVVFNQVAKPDEYEGQEKYALTIALDKESKKLVEKLGLKTFSYKDQTQLTMKRKVEFGMPKIYNKDRELVDINHLSFFGDEVTVKAKQGKGKWDAFAYLEAIRVEQKAEGVEEADQSDF